MSSPLISSIGIRHLFPIIIIVVGISMSGYGAVNYYQQNQAVENAVEVNATVTGTDIETVHHRRSDNYAPVVTFEYRYQGTLYTSNNMYPTGAGLSYDSKSKARESLEKYGSGERITAYVNPSSPSSGFLKEKQSKKSLYFLGIGGFLALASVVQFFRSS